MSKVKFLLAVLFLVVFSVTFSGCYFKAEPCPVVAYIINMSPRELAENRPDLYSAATSFLKRVESSKWHRSYKYVFISKGVCNNFEGKKYLNIYPTDAVDTGESIDGTTFLVFSNNPPDPKLFKVTNQNDSD